MDGINKVGLKLQKARVELQELNLKKSGHNKYSGFSYFELSDFLPTVNKIFLNLGLFSRFTVGERRAVLTIYDESGQALRFSTVTASANIKGAQEIQNLGAMHTYLKRYLYLNALEIVEGESIDALPQDNKPKKSINEDKLIADLKLAKDLADLRAKWVELTNEERANERIAKTKEQLKKVLEEKSNETGVN